MEPEVRDAETLGIIPWVALSYREPNVTANMDDSYDFRGKKIGIIGGGSSAIQIVPKLQSIEGTNLSCFVRSKTWVSNRFGDFIMNQMGWDKNDLTSKQMMFLA